jgi:hypothetical protein
MPERTKNSGLAQATVLFAIQNWHNKKRDVFISKTSRFLIIMPFWGS